MIMTNLFENHFNTWIARKKNGKKRVHRMPFFYCNFHNNNSITMAENVKIHRTHLTFKTHEKQGSEKEREREREKERKALTMAS